jgi:CrcB protein
MAGLLLVMIGGALGAGARHLTGRLMMALLGTGYPWGTLTVNLVGGVLMGLLVGALTRLNVPGDQWRLFLGVGILGGFTTFSSFALDAVMMIERGAWGMALGYALVSVVGSVLAVFAGLAAVRALA